MTEILENVKVFAQQANNDDRAMTIPRRFLRRCQAKNDVVVMLMQDDVDMSSFWHQMPTGTALLALSHMGLSVLLYTLQ